MENQIIPSSPLAQIEALIANDPRLHSDHSRRQYLSILNHFNAWRGDRPVTKTLVEAYIAALQNQGLAPDTIRQKQAAIRWWARKVMDLAEEQPSDDPAIAYIIKQAARVVTMEDIDGESKERGRHMEREELIAFLAACDADPSPAGKRDKAIIWLAWSNGLRRATLASLQMADLKAEQYKGRINYISKREKHGTAYLFKEAWRAMQAWLLVRGEAPGPIFTPVNKSDKIITDRKPMSGEALRKILRARFLQAGLSEHTTWHTFRYTFAGNLIDEGYDITTVQALMLHASPVQTGRYDKRAKKHQQEAVLSLSTLKETTNEENIYPTPA